MSKRIIIWFSVALAGVGVFIALQRVKKTEMEQEERVTFHKRSGDLVQFLTRELQQYGGALSLTSSLPVLRTEWRYAEDAKGFQILLAQTHRNELIRCLTQSLGEPTRRDQYPHLVYREDRFGVGIVVDLQSDQIHIVCLRRGTQ